jgi:hypothetical protein
MKNFESIRKPSQQRTEEGGIKKAPKKKDYKGPKRIRGSFRILREEDIDIDATEFSEQE